MLQLQESFMNGHRRTGTTNLFEKRWEQSLAELAAFKKEHGHLRACKAIPEQFSLAIWIYRQRCAESAGTLRPDRKAQLDELGFQWNAQEVMMADQWERRFAELVRFQHEHGHLRLSKTKAATRQLAGWIGKQRAEYRNGTLPPKRRARLEELGVQWDARDFDNQWNRHFAKLARFQQQHGHLRLSKTKAATRQLAGWIGKQRAEYRDGTLSPERRARLEELGVPWDAKASDSEMQWQRRCAELTAFHQEHGHPHPSRESVVHKSLAGWVKKQRALKRCGKLPADHEARLNALGLRWTEGLSTSRHEKTDDGLPKDALSQWDHFFDRLVTFKQQHGHPHVPSPWAEDRALSIWVREQRSGKLYGRLHFDQITRLEKLGFAWKAPKIREMAG
jgi:hypothetical protein